MARNSPKYQGQGSHADRDERRNPDGTPKEQLLHIRFAYSKRAERGRFRLTQEHEDGIKLVLM